MKLVCMTRLTMWQTASQLSTVRY